MTISSTARRKRRGRYTLNHDLGGALTVLYGDLLYTKAYGAAAEAGRLEVVKLINWVSRQMVEGELLQNHWNYKADIDEPNYFEILKRKTAYLFGGTTKTAALLADYSEEDCQALFDFGFNLGVSFQLMDDYLDYMGDERVMGKPVLSDLKEGKVTLPIIRLFQDQPHIKSQIQTLWSNEAEDISPEILNALHQGSYLSDALSLAQTYAERAQLNLERFPRNRYYEILYRLPAKLLQRTK